MVSKGNFDDLPRASSAGISSGDGGGGGGGAGDAAPTSAPPFASPSRDPGVPAASPPPLQPPGPPPHPADEDMDEVRDDEEEEPGEEGHGDWDWDQEERDYHLRHLEEGECGRRRRDREIEDDADSGQPEEGEIEEDHQDRGENIRGSSDSTFFSILCMSDRTNVPNDIIRDGFVPLNKLEYFSSHKYWRQLLGRYRSYHRSKMVHPVVNGAFRRPHDYPRALGSQEPISELIAECSNNDIIQEKIKILSQQYVLFRRTRSDSSCFYRALLFSYLENLGKMQDRQAEVIRLMACVEVTIKRINQLEWNEAYFSNPEKYFSSVVHEFYSLVNSVANGLASDKLYERSLKEMSSGRIISFLRLLTEIEIRTQNINKPYVPEEFLALQFCSKKVRGLDAEAGAVQMRALTYALGIPLRVEVVDIKKWTDEAVRVKRLDFFRQSDRGKGRVHIVRSYHSSSTTHKPLKRGSDDDLLSSDGAPMLTLLSRRGHCDILYPK